MSQGFTTPLPIPLPVNQGGTGVVTSTGTGNTVLSNSPTLSSPLINQINDTNNNQILNLTPVASAVNYLTFGNAIAAGAPYVQAQGSDSNININMFTKGTGNFNLVSSNLTTPLVLYSGTSSQHITNFAFANTSATRTLTFPDATGTVALTTDIPTAATQSDQETATSTTTYVSPGRQQYHPSAAKMWCYATYSGSTPVNNASYNQSSITDTNTGLMTHNFTVSFSSANYVPLVTRPDPSNLAYTPSASNLATGSVQSYTVQDNGTPGDLGRVICCFGDQ